MLLPYQAVIFLVVTVRTSNLILKSVLTIQSFSTYTGYSNWCANTVTTQSHQINHTSRVSTANSRTSTVQGMRWCDDKALLIRILWHPAIPPWESGEVSAGDGPGGLFRSGWPFIQCLLAERILTVTIFPTSSARLGSSTYNNIHTLQCKVTVFTLMHND